MELSDANVGQLIAVVGTVAGALIGLIGQHVIGTCQRRAGEQRERLEELQEAATDYSRAVQSLDLWREEPAAHAANPPPDPALIGPALFDEDDHRARLLPLLEPWADASARLKRYGGRVRDAQARTLAADLRAAGSPVLVRPVMDQVTPKAVALDERINEVLRKL